MDNYNLKFRHIVLTFLKLNFIVAALYLLLYWIFILEIEIHVKDVIAELIVPGMMAGISTLIWLRPKLKMLIIKNDRLYTLYYFVAVIFMVWLMFLSASYLTVVTNKVAIIKSVEQVSKNKTRFFKISNYKVLTQFTGFTYAVKKTGKYGDRIVLDTYFIAPLVSSGQSGKVISNSHKYWILSSYSESEDTSTDEKVIDRIFELFVQQSERQFLNGDNLLGIDHFERLLHSDRRDYAIEAIKKVVPNIPEDIIIISPSKDNLNKNADTYLKWMPAPLILGPGLLMFMLLFSDIRLAPVKRRKNKDYLEFLFLFVPNKSHVITPMILTINSIIFVYLTFNAIEFLHSSPQELLEAGGLKGTQVSNGELWRLISYCFIHSDFIHFANNMIAVLFLGIYMEPLIGKYRFVIIYLTCGIVAGITSITFNDNIITVGASGAIFGLFAIAYKYSSQSKNTKVQVMIIIYAGISLLMGFLVKGVDNAAHIGGLLCGIVMYYIFKSHFIEYKNTSTNE